MLSYGGKGSKIYRFCATRSPKRGACGQLLRKITARGRTRHIFSASAAVGRIVYNLFINWSAERLPPRKQSLYLLPVKVPRRRLPAWDQKGTPVKIRDYPRSCKLRCAPHTLRATVHRTGRRAEGASQKTCLTDIRHPLSGYRAVQQLCFTLIFLVKPCFSGGRPPAKAGFIA